MKEIFETEIAICDIHAKRIGQSIDYIKSLLPLSGSVMDGLSYNEVSAIELLLNRFSKLQDAIGAKIFPALLDLMIPNTKHNSFIDNLNMLEKLELLENAWYWRELRDMRNLLAHEYPGQEDFMAGKINEAIDMAKWLCKYWDGLKPTIYEKLALLAGLS